MLRRSKIELSRRNAMRIGVGSAVATAAIGNTMAHTEVPTTKILVDGAIDGECGTFVVDVEKGSFSKTAEPRMEESVVTRHFRLPAGHNLFDESVNGDLLVCDDSGEESRLVVLNSMRELKSTINTVGRIADVRFSPDGTKIGLIESDQSGFRLVVMNVNGSGRQVINEVDQSVGMRGLSWSPCGKCVAVVAYDWQQIDETRGVPTQASHRIEMFVGSNQITRFANSDWLNRIEWVSV